MFFKKIFLNNKTKSTSGDTDPFGTALRDAILLGKDTKTDLRVRFEERLLQNTGLLARHSYLSSKTSSPALFIDVVPSDYEKLLSAPNWKEQGGICYPKGDAKEKIVDALQKAWAEVEAAEPQFLLSDCYIVVQNYQQIAENIYFSLFIAKLDEAVRTAFPRAACHLRFCRSYQSRHYYLIFANQAEMETAESDGTVGRITHYVFDFCTSNDPLHIFAGEPPRPYVTTKEALIQSGQAMGIMRENPDFTTL